MAKREGWDDWRAREFGRLLMEKVGQEADVFIAVRQHEGRLVRGYWYRVWEDEERKRWVKFGLLGEDELECRRAIRTFEV